MRSLSSYFAIVVLLAFGPDTALSDAIDDTVNSVMTSKNVRGAMVVIKIPENSETTIRAYGKVASADDSAAVTVDTAFQLASISKTFTGVAIAVLLDQGKITSIDNDICAVKPAGHADSTCRNPMFSTVPITWRMLATHRSSLHRAFPSVNNTLGDCVSPTYGPKGGYATSGCEAAGNPTCPITDVRGFYRDYFEQKPSETLVGRVGLTVEGGNALEWYPLSQTLDEDGVPFTWSKTLSPGTTNTYSNVAVGYIAALVEHATGVAFSTFCNTNIFNKLGMSNTRWFKEELPASTPVAMPVARESGMNVDVGHYCYIDYASGQLYTTANDLAKWGDIMLNKGVGTLWKEATSNSVFGCQEKDASGTLLPEDTCKHSLSYFYLSNTLRDKLIAGNFDETMFPQTYWLSSLQKYDWTDGIWHDGAEEGIASRFVLLPSAKVYVFVVSNTSGNSDDAMQVLLRDAASTAIANAPIATPSPTASPAATPAPGGCAIITNGLRGFGNAVSHLFGG